MDGWKDGRSARQTDRQTGGKVKISKQGGGRKQYWQEVKWQQITEGHEALFPRKNQGDITRELQKRTFWEVFGILSEM